MMQSIKKGRPVLAVPSSRLCVNIFGIYTTSITQNVTLEKRKSSEGGIFL